MVRDNQTPKTAFAITSSESPYPHLLSPIDAGPMTLSNRVIMGSMHTLIERLDRARERLAAFYAARRGSAGQAGPGGGQRVNGLEVRSAVV